MSNFEIGDDIIDSRDLYTHLEELKSVRQYLVDALDEAQEAFAEDPEDEELKSEAAEAEFALKDWDIQYEEEVKMLEDAEKEIPDFMGGTTLINASYFERYAQDFADDIGAINADAKWPLTHIDWEAAAEELQQDYACITLEDTDYYLAN